MLKKLPLDPVRLLRVFSLTILYVSVRSPRSSMDSLRKALFAKQESDFTLNLVTVTYRMEVYVNRIRISVAIAITLVLTGIATPITSAATKPKSAGRTSSSIPNTILSGKGSPSSTLGIDGDFYIDTRSLLIYGPKKSKKWPLPQSLQGPIGVSGVDGKNGNEGKTISSASNIAGPSGTQGDKGEKGDKGEVGSAGSNGAAGAPGSTGPTGATGPAGSSGGGGGTPGATGPTGPQGVIGVTGAKGETGTVGSLGTTGAKGETGTVGATGPSNVYVTTLSTWTLSTDTPRTSATSIFLPKFLAGKSYLYTIHLSGSSNAANGLFEINIIHEDNSASTFNYISTSKLNFEGVAGFNLYSFMITGVITPGASDVAIAIKVIDDGGLTSTNPLTLTGRMFSTLVGSIGTL